MNTRVPLKTTMAFDVVAVAHLLVVAHGKTEPSNDAWAAFVSRVRAPGTEGTSHLIYSDGGQPTWAQHREIGKVLAGRPVWVALVTDSFPVRVTAWTLSSFGGLTKVYSPVELLQALEYLDLRRFHVVHVRRKLNELKRKVGAR